jgi:hypothetical protein
MKIRLAFLSPYNNQWIGWWDRKYGIYYKNLDEIFFEKYMIYVTKDKNQIQLEWREVILTEDMLEDFMSKKNIEFIYLAGAKISKETEDILLKNRTGLINVNFTPIYTTDPRKLNLIISMTDYWKLYWMHGKLSNSSVVYNPVDVENWKSFWKIQMESIGNNLNEKNILLVELLVLNHRSGIGSYSQHSGNLIEKRIMIMAFSSLECLGSIENGYRFFSRENYNPVYSFFQKCVNIEILRNSIVLLIYFGNLLGLEKASEMWLQKLPVSRYQAL